jgi:hypothetical protein
MRNCKRSFVLGLALGIGSLGLLHCGGDGGKDGGAPADLGGGALQWYTTCGDPVCHGYTPPAGVPACTAGMTSGSACAAAGSQCDPMSSCNQLLVCASKDPKVPGCPISRERYKTDITYLDAPSRQKYADQLHKMRLATYRYKAGGPPHLGFIIENEEPSMSIDADRDMVDLYGYTSMAVAALQVQQQQIAALQEQLRAVQQQLAARRGRK